MCDHFEPCDLFLVGSQKELPVSIFCTAKESEPLDPTGLTVMAY